ncbi:MAG: PEP-CTERM sorting domain-containing protein [Burkholderiales bacterium]|nr:PEP-CTERM sorting domain-containing protein [Burkholderiales bacterium]
MTLPHLPRPLRRLGLSLVLASAWLPATTVHAADLSGNVTVSLLAPGGTAFDPTPIALSDTVAVSSAVEFSPGNGTNVGSFMLSNDNLGELIDFKGHDVYVRVLQGADNGTTGYLGTGGTPARYEFSGLTVPGELITGLSYTATDGFGTSVSTGLSNLPALQAASFIHLTSSHGFVLALDALQFVDRGTGTSNNYADFKITLQTTAVPEPGTLAMSMVGLGLIGLGLRGRAQRAA